MLKWPAKVRVNVGEQFPGGTNILEEQKDKGELV